jgi:hypothetical protein
MHPARDKPAIGADVASVTEAYWFALKMTPVKVPPPVLNAIILLTSFYGKKGTLPA